MSTKLAKDNICIKKIMKNIALTSGAYPAYLQNGGSPWSKGQYIGKCMVKKSDLSGYLTGIRTRTI